MWAPRAAPSLDTRGGALQYPRVLFTPRVAKVGPPVGPASILLGLHSLVA